MKEVLPPEHRDVSKKIELGFGLTGIMGGVIGLALSLAKVDIYSNLGVGLIALFGGIAAGGTIIADHAVTPKDIKKPKEV